MPRAAAGVPRYLRLGSPWVPRHRSIVDSYGGGVSCERGTPVHRHANIAHMRQPRPDYVRGFQVQVLQPFSVVSSSLGTGPDTTIAQSLRRAALYPTQALHLKPQNTPKAADPKSSICHVPPDTRVGGAGGSGGCLGLANVEQTSQSRPDPGFSLSQSRPDPGFSHMFYPPAIRQTQIAITAGELQYKSME